MMKPWQGRFCVPVLKLNGERIDLRRYKKLHMIIEIISACFGELFEPGEGKKMVESYKDTAFNLSTALLVRRLANHY